MGRKGFLLADMGSILMKERRTRAMGDKTSRRLGFLCYFTFGPSSIGPDFSRKKIRPPRGGFAGETFHRRDFKPIAIGL